MSHMSKEDEQVAMILTNLVRLYDDLNVRLKTLEEGTVETFAVCVDLQRVMVAKVQEIADALAASTTQPPAAPTGSGS